MADDVRQFIPLPDKPVRELTPEEMIIFRQWMGFEPGGGVVPYPTPEEAENRRRREEWKARYAGKSALEPRLLIRQEQVDQLNANAARNPETRKWREELLALAEEALTLPEDFFASFIPELGPWNAGGNYCPACIGVKSPEGINTYFWRWDWRDPDRLECPFCGTVFPNAAYPENGELVLPRTGKRYTFYVRPEELATADWRLGEKAARHVDQPTHVSFVGNIRSLKIIWALDLAYKLALAYALTGKAAYVTVFERILSRFADVYGGYLLQSYFHDVCDADPGYAVDHADALPTVFKRNAVISVYDGRYGWGHERTTTRVTRVATGLWGSSRIGRELCETSIQLLRLLQAYDLVAPLIAPETRRRIEQDFLLELYLDVRAYEYITNKAGSVRGARVAFGLMYDEPAELDAGLEGYYRILQGQFHPDGSVKETPGYGHMPIGQDLWKVPEMLRGRMDLYAEGLYPAALRFFGDLTTPLRIWPLLDDTNYGATASRIVSDVARARLGIDIVTRDPRPSEFAMFNLPLPAEPPPPIPHAALNRYYEGRRLVCLGYGAGEGGIQLFMTGEDGCRIHRHADCLNIQLYAGGREIFPDLGYIWDHPGNRWVKATASHQTVVIDEQSIHWADVSTLHAIRTARPDRYADMSVPLTGGGRLRRAVTLLAKRDGLPILVDVMDVTGGQTHDYQMRVLTPPHGLTLEGEALRPRATLYQADSYYPLLDFQTGGARVAGWTATWNQGGQYVRATVLVPCDELITYRSPGWRHPLEITAHPDKYFDTVVLRKTGGQSRYVVVYEVYREAPLLQVAMLAEAAEGVMVALDVAGMAQTVCVP